jgi:hypothetical protein
MVFGIVHLVCSSVPLYVVRCSIAVPQQHAVFEHFDQTGAAQHPALFKPLCKFVQKWMRKVWWVKTVFGTYQKEILLKSLTRGALAV